MADIYGIGEPESSGDDSVSLTSTIESDGEGKEYEVDRILAESIQDGKTSYLTQWTGYPEYMSTWQLINTFGESGDVFKSWKEQKMRISRGYERAFDIDAWERRRDEEFKKVLHRKERRARKKARLNRQVDSLPSDSEGSEENADQAQLNKDIRTPVARVSPRSSSGDTGSRSSAQRRPENGATKAPWTTEEQQAFVKGLQEAKGPYWNDILAWYGPRGSINQLLKEKSEKDMQRQLKALRLEFTEVGRDPPEYMSLPRAQPVSGTPKKIHTIGGRHRRTKTDKESDSNDSGTSTDSMLAEIREREISKRPPKPRGPGGARKEGLLSTERSSNPLRSGSVAGSSHPMALKKEISPPLQLSNIPQGGSQAGSSHPGGPKRDKPLTSQSSTIVRKGSAGERSGLGSIKQSVVVRAEPAKQPYSGTARPTTSRTMTDRSMIPNRSRLGVVGSGPARLPLSRPKPRASGPPPHSRSSGIDVTANWATVTEPKIRRAVPLPSTNAFTGSKPSGKLFTWNVRNVVQKGRKKEPAPNLAGVVLLDPKTGRPPKPLPPSPVVESVKAPLRKFQEEINTENEGRHAQEIEDTAVDAHDFLSVSNGQLSTEAGSGEQVEDVSAGVSNISTPDQSTSTLLGKSDITPTPLSHIPPQSVRKHSQDIGPPPHAPAGPRASTGVSAQPSLNPNIRFSVTDLPPSIPANALDGAVSSTAQALQPASDLPLRLMGNPTPQERRELWGKTETDVVYGNIKIGPALDDLGRMRLMGPGWRVKKLLLANKNPNNLKDMGLNFEKICTIAEYQNYMHDETTEYVGSGYVAPFPEAQEKYESTAHLLACHMSIGFLFASQFTMVIWPAHSSVWAFLEKNLQPVPPGAVLRFAIREPMPQRLAEKVKPPITLHGRLEDPVHYEELETTISETPVQPEEKHINIIFRDIFDIQFDRLIASNGTQRNTAAKNFFLCFYPANCENYEPDESKRQVLRWRASEEHDLFIEFLRANRADAIYSMQDAGSYEVTNKCPWDYFLNNVKSGAIILHDSCGRPDQLPHLAKLLRYQGAINVWKTSLSPMDPEVESHPHLVRLFPHGGVICLTSSLMLYHPYEALRILRWFRLFHLPSKPLGIWKIALRPRIREWLLDIQDLTCDKTGQTPFGFSLQVYADIYTEIWILLTRVEEPFGLMVELWDSEIPLREAPIISASCLPRGRKEWIGDRFGTAEVDHEAIRWNDEEIIQWFSEWAGLHLDEHRKFHVVLGYSKGHEVGDYVTKCYEKGYGYLEHGPSKPGRQELGLFVRSSDSVVINSAWERNFLEIISYEKCFELHNVKDQATINKAEADRRQKAKDDASRLLAEAEKERKEARQAAKEGLENLMQMCRDGGGTEEQARAAGRRRLLWKRDEQGTATDKEVEECAIDMDLVLGNQAGWNNKIIAGTPEERAQAMKEQDIELLRLANKERLSGTQEQQRLWDAEIEMWAAHDRAKQDEDHRMTDAADGEPELLARTVYNKVLTLEPELVDKLAGMLLQLESSRLLILLQDELIFRAKVREAKILFLQYIDSDEARDRGDVEEWAPALEAYCAAEAKRAAEINRARKRESELGTPSDGSFEEGEIGGVDRRRRERVRGRRKRAREEEGGAASGGSREGGRGP